MESRRNATCGYQRVWSEKHPSDSEYNTTFQGLTTLTNSDYSIGSHGRSCVNPFFGNSKTFPIWGHSNCPSCGNSKRFPICGYSLTVEFLASNEKMRVRFPLLAPICTSIEVAERHGLQIRYALRHRRFESCLVLHIIHYYIGKAITIWTCSLKEKHLAHNRAMRCRNSPSPPCENSKCFLFANVV